MAECGIVICTESALHRVVDQNHFAIAEPLGWPPVFRDVARHDQARHSRRRNASQIVEQARNDTALPMTDHR